MKESKITSEKQNLCPLCGAPLPDGAAFCPHCARSIKPRTRQKAPRPLQKKFLHIAALAAALAVVVGGTWLYNPPPDGGGRRRRGVHRQGRQLSGGGGDLTAPTSRLRSYVRQPRQA